MTNENVSELRPLNSFNFGNVQATTTFDNIPFDRPDSEGLIILVNNNHFNIEKFTLSVAVNYAFGFCRNSN